MRGTRRGTGLATVALLAACARPTPAPAPPPAPPASGSDAGAASAANVTNEPTDGGTDAGTDAGLLIRISGAHGCTDPAATAARTRAPASSCVIRGSHAFVYGVVVPFDDGTFMEVGLYGGGAEVDAPTTHGAPTRVRITEPLEVEGIVPYDQLHLALVHTQGGQVHPTLKLARGAAISGIADGGRFRARALFDGYFAVGPLDLPCDAVGLGDYNRLETETPKDNPNKLVPPRGKTIRVDWQNTGPVLKATIDATDGLRLLDAFSDDGGLPFHSHAVFEVLDRRQDHVKIRARTAGGTELAAWVKSDALEPVNGGRGEGIGLCGCGHGSIPWRSKEMTLARGASVHARPDGPAWARAPAPVKVLIEPEPRGAWRKVTMIQRLSEGGDACPSERLEHAWVRAADLQ